MFQIRTDCLCSICRLYSKVYNEHKLDIATKNSIKARKSDDTSLRIYKFITTELAFMVQTYDGASTMWRRVKYLGSKLVSERFILSVTRELNIAEEANNYEGRFQVCYF